MHFMPFLYAFQSFLTQKVIFSKKGGKIERNITEEKEKKLFYRDILLINDHYLIWQPTNRFRGCYYTNTIHSFFFYSILQSNVKTHTIFNLFFHLFVIFISNRVFTILIILLTQLKFLECHTLFHTVILFHEICIETLFNLNR